MATSSQGEAFHKVVLQALKAHKNSLEQTPEQEIEEKFVRLSLAFKTDKLTLDKRVELHQRSRDVAEQNIEQQMGGVKEALKVLGPLCKDAKSREVFSKIEHHVEVLGSSTARMSSRAEVLGAVKQEYRISEAIEVMIQHVENLKQSLDREHAELEEAKRLLVENRALGHGVEADALLHRRSLSVTSHGVKHAMPPSGYGSNYAKTQAYVRRSASGQRGSTAESIGAATSLDQEQ